MISFFRKKSHAEEFAAQVAKEYSEKGVQMARDALDRMRAHCLAACLDNPRLAKMIAEGESQFVLGFELMFLWGFFHEHVQTLSLPTNGYDRILIHTMQHLIEWHGWDLRAAVHEVRGLQQMYDRDDALFSVVSEFGKKAYRGDGGENAMTAVLLKVLDARDNGWDLDETLRS